MFSKKLLSNLVLSNLVLFILTLCGLGFYALSTAPVISFKQTSWLEKVEVTNIKRIEHVLVNRSFFLRFPEFFTPTEEKKWWQKHKEIYHLLNNKKTINIEFTKKDKSIQKLELEIHRLSSKEIFKRAGLIYLVSFVYLLAGIVVFPRSYNLPGYLCSLFLFSGACYFASAAPIVTRPITLHPLLFQILIKILYFSAGGLITLVHFSLIFPKPKNFLNKIPYTYLIFYIYFLLTIMLYFSGIIAFGTTFPFLCLWIIILIISFLHSLFMEKNKLLRKQIQLVILAPLLVSLVFVILHLLPGILRITPVNFTYFALFSLIIPFALPLGIENFHLYKEKIEAERKIENEKNNLRKELHDTILNNLSLIFISSESALKFIKNRNDQLKNRLLLIKELSQSLSEQLRNFLWIISNESDNWDDFCNYLRGCSYKILETAGIECDFILIKTITKNLSSSLKINIYQILREILINIIKHSCATSAKIILGITNDQILLKIKDNGKGFDMNQIEEEGHFGLKNMEERIKKLGGTFILDTIPDRGTSIKVSIPLPKNTSPGV